MSEIIIYNRKRLNMNSVRTREDFQDVHLTEIFNLLGYSTEMIQYRRDKYKKIDEIENKKLSSLQTFTCGAKAEGTALYFESDIDRLFVLKGSMCLETTQQDLSGAFVFHLDFTGCTAGYCRLKFVREDEKNEWTEKVHKLLDDTTKYLRNTFSFFSEIETMIDVNGCMVTKKSKKGPSLQYANNEIKYDYVSGFSCSCPSLLQKWVQRPRTNEWPTRTLIEEVAHLEAHVVPVPDKDSKFPSFEWRICFTQAELFLINSLSEFDIKVYVLFKLVVKAVLRPICEAISSYIVKNIILWIKERTPLYQNTNDTIVDKMFQALDFLRHCIQMKQLNSYMIEERNLFKGRISEHESTSLNSAITQLLSEGNNVVYRVTKVEFALQQMKSSHEDFKKQCETRNEVERLEFEKNIVFKLLAKSYVEWPVEEFLAVLKQDGQYKALTAKIYSILDPRWEMRIRSDPSFESVMNDKIRVLLS